MKTLFVMACITILGLSALAADHQPTTASQAAGRSQVRNDIQSRIHNDSAPAYCRGKHCLYYAGDFDPNNTGADGICFMYNGVDGCELVIGVRAEGLAIVTGGTWNALVEQTFFGTNPTPFEVREGVSNGNGGKVICATSGSATMRPTGRNGFGFPEYSYTIRKLSKPCVLTKGTLLFVGMQPQYTDGLSSGFLSDAEDIPSPHHHGWKNVPDESFECGMPECFWTPGHGPGGVCGELGCDVFSIALTGIQQ